MCFACAGKNYGYAGCDDSWLWSALFSNKPFPAPGAIRMTPNPLTPRLSASMLPCFSADVHKYTCRRHGGSVVRWLKLSVRDVLHFSQPPSQPQGSPPHPKQLKGGDCAIIEMVGGVRRKGDWASFPKKKKGDRKKRRKGGWVSYFDFKNREGVEERGRQAGEEVQGWRWGRLGGAVARFCLKLS